MSVDDVVKERIKQLTKDIRKCHKEWGDKSDERREFIKNAPTHGNEFDYSMEMGYEDQGKANDMENEVHHGIGIEMGLKGEKEYLQSLIKCAKNPKNKIGSFGRHYGLL